MKVQFMDGPRSGEFTDMEVDSFGYPPYQVSYRPAQHVDSFRAYAPPHHLVTTYKYKRQKVMCGGTVKFVYSLKEPPEDDDDS